MTLLAHILLWLAGTFFGFMSIGSAMISQEKNKNGYKWLALLFFILSALCWRAA